MKFAFKLRSGVTLMLPMMTSNFPAISAGMIPAHFVGTSWSSTPRSLARRFATSISKPTNSPFLSCMAHGTNEENPTRSTPRLTTSSIMDVCASFACARPGRIKAAASINTAKIAAK